MIISDDIMAVDLRGKRSVVYPAFPQFKIDPRAAAALNYDEADLFQLHPREPKRGHRIVGDFPDQPIPLKQIYILALGEAPRIEPCPSHEAIIELIRHSFIKQKSAAADHLQRCGQLAKLAPVYRLHRVQSLPALPDLAQFIERHIINEPQSVAV
jgi:hypothetical protein